jgi:hypothetical protein
MLQNRLTSDCSGSNVRGRACPDLVPKARLALARALKPLRQVGSRLGLIALIALPLSVASPSPLFSQEGRPEAGRDPRRGVETDERRRDDTARQDDWRRNAAEVAGRRTDITVKRNSEEYRDANRLSAEISAQRSAEAKFDQKIKGQMDARGWNEKEIRDLIKSEPVGLSVDTRNGKNDTATVYGKHGEYVVLNDRTKEIVQISDKKNPSWKDDSRIHWK